MNIFLWVLRGVFALYSITGGTYMMGNYKNLGSGWALALPKFFWILLGVIQITAAIGLVIPNAKISAISALVLAVIYLLGLVLYTSYRGFPGVLWGLLPAIVLAFVAYMRMPKG